MNKNNILWWFKNDDEPLPPDGYLRDRPHWWRVLCWHLRNPLHNFNNYVIGFKNEEFYTAYTPDENLWHDKWVIGGGWGEMRHWVPSRYKAYKFWCYRGKTWEGYFGWDQRGAFGMALRSAHSVNAGDM